MLIGFLGKKGTGKDTCCDYIASKYQFEKIAIANPLKEAIKILFDFSDDQVYGNSKENKDEYWNIEPRKVLQYIGTDIFRNKINELIPNVENNFWIYCLEKKYLLPRAQGVIKTQLNDISKKNNIIISDIRFQNEIDLIHKYNGIIIKLNRNTNYLDSHESEKNIDYLQGDFLIDNNDQIDKLYQKLDLIMENIIK